MNTDIKVYYMTCKGYNEHIGNWNVITIPVLAFDINGAYEKINNQHRVKSENVLIVHISNYKSTEEPKPY